MTLTTFRLSRAAIAFLATTLMVAASSIVGCGTQCDRNPDAPPIGYDGGIKNRAAGTYFTADVGGPFLDFPPGRTYRLYHGLGGTPQVLHAYLSFDEYPKRTGGGFVEAAGNQVTYEAVTATYVDVRNDTCSDVRIRVELSDPVPDGAPDASITTPVTASDGGDAGG